MTRIAYACIALAALPAAAPAYAVANDNGDILISQAAVNAGGITPGDAPGFPVTISVPGTYRLTSNLAVTTAVTGIQVQANEVTIDMGGHTLAGSGVGRNGIASFNRSLTVQNGNVRGFTNDGIRSIAPYLEVENVRVLANGRFGVIADPGVSVDSGDYARVTNSSISGNGDNGVVCGSACHVEGDTISRNLGSGVYVGGAGATVLGNTIAGNGNYGITFGFSGGAGNNTLVNNPYGGISGNFLLLQPNACNPACSAPP